MTHLQPRNLQASPERRSRLAIVEDCKEVANPPMLVLLRFCAEKYDTLYLVYRLHHYHPQHQKWRRACLRAAGR